MLKLHVLDNSGKEAGEIQVPEEILAYPVKEHLLYEAVINYQANQRRGTASTKTRGEVSGGGRKPWRQKGTGRARAGSIRSPLWKKGGTTFGPKPKDYSYSLPKKEKKNALRSAISMKYAESRILVLQDIGIKEPRTKEAAKFLGQFQLGSALVVDSRNNANLFLSVRNIPKVKAVDHHDLNVFDVMNHDWLVFSEKALESLMERLK